MGISDPTLKWQRRPFPRYFPNCLLSFCRNIGLDSDYIIPEVNNLGVASAGGLDLLFLEYTEVSINFSLKIELVSFLTSIAGEFNLIHLNGVDTEVHVRKLSLQ